MFNQGYSVKSNPFAVTVAGPWLVFGLGLSLSHKLLLPTVPLNGI